MALTPNSFPPYPPHPSATDGEWNAYRADHAAWQRARNFDGMLHIIGAVILGVVAIAIVALSSTVLIGDLVGSSQ